MTFRNAVKALSPGPMQEGVGERYMYVFGFCTDALMQKMTEAGLARMPTRCDPTCLPVIGSDRLIGQGLTESVESYRVRLQKAFESWQLAGSARSVMVQVLGYLLSLTPMVRTVFTRFDPATYPPTAMSSTWDTYEAGQGIETAPVHVYNDVTSAVGANWDWDSLSQVSGSWGSWGAFLVIYSVSPNATFTRAPKWGSGVKWGSGRAWGVNESSRVGRSIQAIAGQWKSAQSWIRWIIVSFDATLFDPEQAAGGGVNPDGYFGRWSKISGGAYVASRFSDALYGDGIA